MAEDKEDDRLIEYYCSWCGNTFKQLVRYLPGIGSDQVKCNKCFRLIPTWRKEKIEGKFTGRLHIHPGR